MEDLVERCRAATGKAAADLVDEATAAPGVLVFGELLDLEGVQALASDPSLASTLAQLRVFAHGTLPDYRADSSLPPLSPAQELKLRRLTVASLAERSAVLSYADLMRALELSTIRELEDLLINECVAAGVVRGPVFSRAESTFGAPRRRASGAASSKPRGVVRARSAPTLKVQECCPGPAAS